LLAVDLDRAGSPVAPKAGDHCVPLEDWAAQTPDGCSGPTVQDDLVVPKAAGRSGRAEYSAPVGCWVPHDCSAPADLAEAGSAARMAAGHSVPAECSAPVGWVPHGYSVLVDSAAADSVVPTGGGHSAPGER